MALIRSLTSIFLGPQTDEETSDYCDVPASDRGNASYRDKGMRGTYAPRQGQFPDPAGLKREAGYGATRADLARGYIDNCVSNDPAYDRVNYLDRSTQPRVPDENSGNNLALPEDIAFRNRNRTSRGFLTRPRIPTERG